MNNTDLEKIFRHSNEGHDLGVTLGNDGGLCITCHYCKEDLFHFHRSELTPEQRKWYVDQAKAQFHDEGTLEVDDNPMLSEGADNGLYVQVWGWVAAPERRLRYCCPECKSLNVDTYVSRTVSRVVAIQHGEDGHVDERDIHEVTKSEKSPHEFACRDCEHSSEERADWLASYEDSPSETGIALERTRDKYAEGS